MKKLLKAYDLPTEHEYFNMCADSYMNGQKTQARAQFSAMPTKYRKDMINYLRDAEQYPADLITFFINAL